MQISTDDIRPEPEGSDVLDMDNENDVRRHIEELYERADQPHMNGEEYRRLMGRIDNLRRLLGDVD